MDHMVLGVQIAIAIYLLLLTIAACIATVSCILAAMERRKAMDKGECKAAGDIIVFDTCSSTEEVGGGCTICLNEYVVGEKRATIAACNHRFHAVCIRTWFKKVETCPLCRHNVV